MDEAGGISVIIPLYNGEPYLEACLRSVLGQEGVEAEVVVVDDGSTDGSAEVVRRYPGVRYVRQEHAGCAAARNRGLRETRGGWVALLDQDDWWEPGALRELGEVLGGRSEAGWAVGWTRVELEPGAPLPSCLPREALQRAQLLYLLGAVLVRREVFQNVGVFDERCGGGDDLDWFARVQGAGIVAAEVSRLILHKRQHKNNASNDTAAMLRERMAVLRQRLARQKRG